MDDNSGTNREHHYRSSMAPARIVLDDAEPVSLHHRSRQPSYLHPGQTTTNSRSPSTRSQNSRQSSRQDSTYASDATPSQSRRASRVPRSPTPADDEDDDEPGATPAYNSSSAHTQSRRSSQHPAGHGFDFGSFALGSNNSATASPALRRRSRQISHAQDQYLADDYDPYTTPTPEKRKDSDTSMINHGRDRQNSHVDDFGDEPRSEDHSDDEEEVDKKTVFQTKQGQSRSVVKSRKDSDQQDHTDDSEAEKEDGDQDNTNDGNDRSIDEKDSPVEENDNDIKSDDDDQHDKDINNDDNDDKDLQDDDNDNDIKSNDEDTDNDEKKETSRDMPRSQGRYNRRPPPYNTANQPPPPYNNTPQYNYQQPGMQGRPYDAPPAYNNPNYPNHGPTGGQQQQPYYDSQNQEHMNLDLPGDQPDLYQQSLGNRVIERRVSSLCHPTDNSPPSSTSSDCRYLRYSAVTCSPEDFWWNKFDLRPARDQRMNLHHNVVQYFNQGLMIIVTMYNEDAVLFTRTMIGVFRNVDYMIKNGLMDEERITIVVISDGRAKINQQTKKVLALLGVYQDGIATEKFQDKKVQAHVYEFTTFMRLRWTESKFGHHGDQVEGYMPPPCERVRARLVFCLKEQNQKKINSHKWAFAAFAPQLQPKVCCLIDAGTEPGHDSIYKLWKAFEDQKVGGACGEIRVLLNGGLNLINPLVAAQNFEYKMSNILDKPLESVMGFITVLPGAFSAYRYEAIHVGEHQPDGRVTEVGPLAKYYLGEKARPGEGIFTANMYLAEDRILCFELVARRGQNWLLRYVCSAHGTTDVPTEFTDFVMQRRRWLNGSFFAAIYSIVHFYRIFNTSHSCFRMLILLLEFVYQLINLIFSWFAVGNFFLVFHILTFSLAESNVLPKLGIPFSIVGSFAYPAILMTCFILALGNRPSGTKFLYTIQVIFWAGIMAYLIFAVIFIAVKAVQAQVAVIAHFEAKMLLTNSVFRSLILSTLPTYILYIAASLLFLDPWHMITCFVQYLLLMPTYINIVNVYAFCNTHDITWGTKGIDKPEKLQQTSLNADGSVDVKLPQQTKIQTIQDHPCYDIDAWYREQANKLRQPSVSTDEKKASLPSEQQTREEDYYKGIRTATVITWIFTNLALVIVVLKTDGFEQLQIFGKKASVTQRSAIFMQVVLTSVAVLGAVRWLGCLVYTFLRFWRWAFSSPKKKMNKFKV